MSVPAARPRNKELGAFYTPDAIAEKLASWAIREPTDRVLDPSFGGLVFLEQAKRHLRELGVSASGAARQIYGVEVDRQVHSAAVELDEFEQQNLILSDFFATSAGDPIPRCQAVIGNPPYVRYQGFNGQGDIGHNVAAAAGVPLTRLASSWAPFVVHATSFVAEGGRMALVLPAEVMHAQYAEPILEFLRRNFRELTLALFEERVFPGALEEVVLLFAAQRGQGPARAIEIASSQRLEDLDLGSCGRETALPASTGQGMLLAQLLPAATQQLYSRLASESTTFGDWGSVNIGAVTGANKFFLVSDPEQGEIPEELLRPAVSKARQIPGARFQERDYQLLRESGEKARIFIANQATDEALLRRARPFLRRGEHEGLPARYKCRVRRPWWAVPLPIQGAPDLFLTYFASEHPRLVVNEGEALHTNTIHGVKLADRRRVRSIAVAFYNSLTMLSTELVGRSYGGGVLKLEPTESEALLLPSPPAGLGRLLPRVDLLVKERNLPETLRLVDRHLLIDGLGLSESQVRLLRQGAERLRLRRLARGQPPDR